MNVIQIVLADYDKSVYSVEITDLTQCLIIFLLFHSESYKFGNGNCEELILYTAVG